MPMDVRAVQRLLNGDMSHRGCWRCAMPMLRVGWTPDDVPALDFGFGFARALRPANTRRDDERLTQGMRVPGSACAGLEGDSSAPHARGGGRLDYGIDAHGAGEILLRAFGRRLRAVAFDFHCSPPCPLMSNR